jgi:hypothetical protein
VSVTAEDFERDFYFRVKHPTLAWSILEVLVRPEGKVWQYAHGYHLPTVGFGNPFEGAAPTRENAGRIGLIKLRNSLRQLAGDGEIEGRDHDQAEAAKHAARIHEMLHPAQPELFDMIEERRSA